MSMRASFKLISSKDLVEKKGHRLWNLNDKQSDFVSLATHQLKTPLSGIKWTLSMLLKGEAGKLTEVQRKWLQTSFDSNERVLGLIDEMLNSIRIDEDKLTLEKAKHNLVQLFQETLDHVEPLVRGKDIDMKMVIDPKGAVMEANVDASKIKLAFENMVENAIRYTKKGGKIEVRIIQETGDVKVSIKDNGIGIPDAEKKDIFARFFRASNAFRKIEKGSGLGLFISKGIIEKHGGQIWFESNEDKGTTFYFIIPTT